MNIKTALKRKNKLTGLIAEEFQKISTYNSIIEGNERPYSVKDVLLNWQKLSQELVELKVSIHKANTPVFDKIFILAELKGQIKQLRGLDCQSGKIDNPYRSAQIETLKTVEITIVEKEVLIKSLEEKIDIIQEELDTFNYNTEI